MTKRTRFLSVILITLAVFLPAKATQLLTLFSGDDSSNTAPINLAYFDEVGTRTQVIYPASSLAMMTGEVINSMKFYTSDPITEGGGMLQISVGETDKTDFLGTSYVEGLTQVASYSMTSGLTEIEIVFDEPYTYMGGNLVFESLVTESTNESFVTFWGTRPVNYNAISRNEISKFLPKTTFNYGTDAPYSAKVLPFELTFKTIRAEREDVQSVVITNTGLNGFSPSLSAEAPFYAGTPNAVILSGESLEVPVRFAPTAAGSYTGVLTVDCGEAGIHQVPLSGTAIEAAEELMVCDSTDYGSFLPIYGADIDIVGTEGQMIYPSSMLTQMAGRKIYGLKFHIREYVEMDEFSRRVEKANAADVIFDAVDQIGKAGFHANVAFVTWAILRTIKSIKDENGNYLYDKISGMLSGIRIFPSDNLASGEILVADTNAVEVYAGNSYELEFLRNGDYDAYDVYFRKAAQVKVPTPNKKGLIYVASVATAIAALAPTD